MSMMSIRILDAEGMTERAPNVFPIAPLCKDEQISTQEWIEIFIPNGFTLDLKSAHGEAMKTHSGDVPLRDLVKITIVGRSVDDVKKLRLQMLEMIGVESRSPRFFTLPSSITTRWSRFKWLAKWIWTEGNEDLSVESKSHRFFTLPSSITARWNGIKWSKVLFWTDRNED